MKGFKVINKKTKKEVKAVDISHYYYGKDKFSANTFFFAIKQDGEIYIVKEGFRSSFKKINENKYEVEFL